MSDRNRRKLDLDYSILHNTGRRVEKIRYPKMASNDLQIQAINVESDIEDLFDTYKLEDLTEVGEIEEFVSKIGELKRDFRRIYAQLKVVEGGNYVKLYPNYESQLGMLTENFKVSNDKLSALKRFDKKKLNEVEKLRADLESEKIKQETEAIKLRANLESEKLKQEAEAIKFKFEEKRLYCKSQWTYFMNKINLDIDNFEWEKIVDRAEAKGIISTFESNLEQFYTFCSEVEGNFGEQVEDFEFRTKNDNFITSIRECISKGKIRWSEIKKENELMLREKSEAEAKERELAESKRIEKEKRQEKERINNLLSCADDSFFEIVTRYQTLKNKCDTDITTLNDYEILDIKKREDSFYTELRELLNKITSFLQFILPCGDLASKMHKNVIEMREKSTKEVGKFFQNVQKVILENDISEKKLKNSAGLKIELPKFKGYYSEMNIYTFRSEFKKLIEPNVQKGLWSDYLKTNCLAGAAYNLVSKIDKIDDIWEKLIEVYGNTRLLFQNKISSLGKFANLEKLRDDEKIAFTISSILNAMTDLSKLAEEYNLKGELYHGGGLQKILELMGRYRERNFIKSIAKMNLKNEEKWIKLENFLKDELQERDAFILNDKAKRCMTLEQGNKNDSSGKEGAGAYPDKKFRDSESSKYKGYISQENVSGENSKSEKTGDVNLRGQNGEDSQSMCHICGKIDNHVISTNSKGKPCVEYIACESFVNIVPRERGQLLFKKRLCSKCLSPGVRWNAHHYCDKRYTCKQTYLKNGKQLKCEKHVLVCGYHTDVKSNKDLLELYKKNVIQTSDKFHEFTKNITISCVSEHYSGNGENESLEDSSIFSLQTIDVEGLNVNLFYDSGCGDMVVSKDCVDKLKTIGRAEQTFSGPIVLNGVGSQESVCPHGAYSISLPLENGDEANMSGVCVDRITLPFPMYSLENIEKDFREKIGQINGNIVPKLPRLPKMVGGEVHVMLGKQYLKYFPKEIAQLESGLTLYRSRFRSSDGTYGVIAGPHPEFTKTDRIANFSIKEKYSYFNPTVLKYKDMYDLIEKVPFLGNKDDCRETPSIVLHAELTDSTSTQVMNETYTSKRAPKRLKIFEQVENTGTNISYRCVDCRNCSECKKGSKIEEMSIQEEVEQNLINKSVKIDFRSRICLAKLPFIADPDSRLVPNLKMARKVYDNQIRKLDYAQKDRLGIIECEAKLQELGFVDYLENLDENDRNLISQNTVKYFIPWRVVWSQSVSTPIRPVFDASQRTTGGCSLNDILAKGANNMNNLIQILIRWTVKTWGFHTDIRKMYNAVQLDRSHWRYQLYLWEKDLNPRIEPKTKVIKTLIYGVKSSGNQAERAVRLTTERKMQEYPNAYNIVLNDAYVDDVISGTNSERELMSVTDELKLSLGEGGFTLKGFSFSGKDPEEKLSADKQSVSVGGLKWYPKEDFLMYNIDELNFSKKVRGRKCEKEAGIPEKLTKRDCVAKVAEIWSPLGKITPITAGMKLDISMLHKSGLSWDDEVPENLRNVWISNFQMMEEIKYIRFKRAIVPPDAVNLDIETIDTGDASSRLICSAIYARFRKKDETYSCQLVFARSKVLPEGISIPRAELMAAVMNAATGYTVKKAFGDLHRNAIKLTDSMVALHWIASKRTTLKTWVRNRVIEINRIIDSSFWRYVNSANMIADIGTRKGAKIVDVNENSEWINGLSWMKKPIEEFPIFTIEQIKLNKSDIEESKKEKLDVEIDVKNMSFYSLKNEEIKSAHVDKEIQSRYQFSNYLIDPNRFRFRKVIRVLGLALTFIKQISKNLPKVQGSKIFQHEYPGKLPKILESQGDKYIVTTGFLNKGSGICVGGKVVELSDDMLECAMYYFYVKTTSEVKNFVDNKKYINKTNEVDNILYYVGRIPTDYSFSGYPELCGAAIDLCHTTFCVPFMDRYSPVAISIALEIHWYHPDVQHSGIEPMLRQTQCVAQILGGRDLVKSIKKGCKKCRILNKKSVEVVMGPIKDVNLSIAPAFYACQIDIFGPFKSYSNVNKRATIKVWFLVLCCCTTGAVDVHVMDDYSTDAFIQAFIRFACRFGYPKFVLPDEGSQLVKGCQNMIYSFSDCKQRMSIEYGVEYIACPVGAHYVHGKVERKIREIKKSVKIHVQNERLSTLQWETLMCVISNSINNLPIGLGNKVDAVENLDIITPNRLLLGRNNNRCPNAPLLLTNDHKKLIECNAIIFQAWFKSWLVSYVPLLMERPKWHRSDHDLKIGDVVLFLKSEQEYDQQYQYGIVQSVQKSQDGHIRKVMVEYQNHSEQVKRVTQRGVRDLVVIYPVDELDIYQILDEMNN